MSRKFLKKSKNLLKVHTVRTDTKSMKSIAARLILAQHLMRSTKNDYERSLLLKLIQYYRNQLLFIERLKNEHRDSEQMGQGQEDNIQGS